MGNRHLDLVECVFELSGGNPNAEDNDGWTPSVWAVRASQNGVGGDEKGAEQESIIQFLLPHGLNIWVTGNGSNDEQKERLW